MQGNADMLGSPGKRNKLFDLIQRISFTDGRPTPPTTVAMLATAAILGLALPSTLPAQSSAPATAAPTASASMANIGIAARTTALSFARHRRGGALPLLLIERFADNPVEAIGLTVSPPSAPTGRARSAIASCRDQDCQCEAVARGTSWLAPRHHLFGQFVQVASRFAVILLAEIARPVDLFDQEHTAREVFVDRPRECR